jgi:16S rRNA (cytosine967-C5)-methyltransferase
VGPVRRPSRNAVQAQHRTVEGLAARQAAAALISAVVDRRQGLDLLVQAASAPAAYRALPPRDAALALAITKSALRHRGTIAALLSAMIERPLPPEAKSVMHILHAAVAQIALLRVPASAAVNLAVEAAQADVQARRYAPLVNGVLRRLTREGESSVQAAFDAAAEHAVNAPHWLLAALAADYGAGQARAILAAHLHEAPLDLTVKSDPAHWADALGGVVLATGTVRLPHGMTPVPELAGFSEGAWWVQDAAAALPARLLGDIAGKRVADICAAPGGKTAQLANAGAAVTAIDISAGRLERLQQNMERLGLPAEIIAVDARAHNPASPYDAVLIDAPCSSTGTLRRHPDVAWTKRETDIAALAGIQSDLLASVRGMLKPGGIVVYANCSLLKAEGEHVIAAFLAANADFAIEPVTSARDGDALAAFADDDGCLRTTPLMLEGGTPALSGMDGFYAARLRRIG